MPRRRRDEAVARRLGQRLADRDERRRQAAQRGAQTRRQRREQQQGEAQAQPAAERPTQAHVTRPSAPLRTSQPRPRAHADMVTVALRGPLAAKMRELAETTGMSLAKLLGDMVLAYEGEVNAGYEPGTCLGRWSGEHAG